VSAGAAA